MTNTDLYLIGGFLGSGKTTLLRTILQWDIDLSNTVVLLNEFGKISIDGMFLESDDLEILELANGCICCSMRGEFVESLQTVLNKFSPKMVFVETTGVADTSEVVDLLKDSTVADQFTMKKIICVLDAELWEGKYNFGAVFFNQIKASDLVLLNKVDLVDKDQVSLFVEELKRVHPLCSILPTVHCQVDPAVILSDDTSFFLQDDKEDQYLKPMQKEEAPISFQSFTYEEKQPLSETSFKNFLDKTDFNVFRIKGLVRFRENAFKLNYVSGRSHWIESAACEETRLVFVGWDLNPEAILGELDLCKIR